MRGEHACLTFVRSPPVHPRMRGEHIPPTNAAPRSAVHPRMRGEHGTHLAMRDGKTVHPRMRGEPLIRNRCWIHFRRFIPACAGNAAWCTPHRERFIPACAGNAIGCLDDRSGAGSSPHARETYPSRTHVLDGGSSPHARGTQLGHRGQDRVHPRMRGEHVAIAVLAVTRAVHPRMRAETHSQDRS